jgi:hypothetical protein
MQMPNFHRCHLQVTGDHAHSVGCASATIQNIVFVAFPGQLGHCGIVLLLLVSFIHINSCTHRGARSAANAGADMGNPSPWQLGFGQLPDFVVGSIKSRVDRESWRHFTFACQSSCAASYACRRHVRLYADRDSGVVVPSMARLATCFPALEQLTLDDDKGVVVAALGCLPDGALPSVRQVEGGYYEGLADEELQQLVRLCPKVERVVKCAVTATAAVLPLLAPWGGSLQKVSCTTNFGRTQWEPRQIAAASAALTSLTRLQDLEMDCGEGRGAIVLAAALPALTSLTRLNLEDWR